MIRRCEALQQAFERLANTSQDYRRFLDPGATYDAASVAIKWPSQPEVRAFPEASVNNHFVCANWKTFDQLRGDGYRSRESLLEGRALVPFDADFMWLRRFIHSVVKWERNMEAPCPPTLRVAAAFQGWSDIAHALQRELDKADNIGGA